MVGLIPIASASLSGVSVQLLPSVHGLADAVALRLLLEPPLSLLQIASLAEPPRLGLRRGREHGPRVAYDAQTVRPRRETPVALSRVPHGARRHPQLRRDLRRRPLRAFEFDATQCPDLFPPLAALAAACEGESLITGTSRLAHKESDRAETLREEYAKVGIEIDLSTPDVMRIRGGAIRPARVFSHGDHRIAMSMAVSALRSSGAITIEGAEAVAKSYPRFFEDLESLRVN